MRFLEVSLIAPISKGDDSDGLFGREAKEGLKQLPSAIYWQGLQTWASVASLVPCSTAFRARSPVACCADARVPRPG